MRWGVGDAAIAASRSSGPAAMTRLSRLKPPRSPGAGGADSPPGVAGDQAEDAGHPEGEERQAKEVERGVDGPAGDAEAEQG